MYIFLHYTAVVYIYHLISESVLAWITMNTKRSTNSNRVYLNL